MAQGVTFIRWLPEHADRFIEQVRSVCEIDEQGCWIWRYGSWRDENREWYPEIMVRRARKSVARWLLEATTGEVGEVARHRCDRMPCCNPDHLLWGTQADNVADRVRRGRSAVGDRSGHRRHPERFRGENHWTKKRPELIRRGADNWRTGKQHPAVAGDRNPARLHPERLARGEAHGGSKLTADEVLTIRSLHACGVSGYRLAKDFGVSKGTIRQIVRRATWKHLEQPAD